MKKYLFIINPAAGHIKVQQIISLINENTELSKNQSETIITSAPGHATEIAKEYSKKVDYIISVGGDGTLNEVINGIIPNSNVKIGVLPLGSGNDFVRNLNYPKDVNDILDLIFDDNKFSVVKCDVGSSTYLDNGKTKHHRFVNALGIGFDAYVAYLNQYEKTLSGITSYVIAVIKALKQYENLKCEIIIDDKTIEKECLLITIGNGETSGGGFYLNPGAIPFDNSLNLTIVDYRSRGKIMRNLPLALVNKLHKVPEVNFYHFNTLTIKLENPYFIHVDGEVISQKVREISISLADFKLNFIKGN